MSPSRTTMDDHASIGVSASFVRPGAVGGAEQALYGLLESLALNPAVAARTTVYSREPLRLPNRAASLRTAVAGKSIRNRFAWDTLALPWAARADRTLFFPNYFTPTTATGKRKVTIIHDLQYLHYPQYFSRTKRAWLRVAHEATLRLADVTVAISNYVRDDILQRYGGQHEHRVAVLPPPIQWEVFSSPDGDSALAARFRDRPFVLSVSAHWPHKNIITLVKAFGRVARQRPDLKLVLVGQPFRGLVGSRHAGETVEAVIASEGLGDRVEATGYIKDADLAWLYANARAFVFPSLFEGMGRPAIEALGSGLPVVTTRCTAIPEVTQGLAVYLDDPVDPGEMASLIVEVSDRPDVFRPTRAQVAALRERYSASTISSALVRLLDG